MSVTITNLVGSIGSFESGTWLLTTAEKAYVHIVSDHVKYGASSLRITGDTAEFERTYTLRNSGGVVKPTLDPTHKYYVRVETYQEEATGSTDIYWPIAEPSMLAGQSGPARQWNVCSAVADRSSFAAGSYEMRIDYNNANTAGIMWFDGLMLVDLTDAFGAGYEPTAAWCDANIPFTDSTASVPDPAPKAPTELQLVRSDADGVALAWSASKWATGYRVYRGTTLVADVPNTSAVIRLTSFGTVQFSVSAYNAAGESARSAAVTVTIEMSLITDRTQEDVEQVRALLQRPYRTWTAEERSWFYGGGVVRGAYNALDLNRVGLAVDAVRTLLLTRLTDLAAYLDARGVAPAPLFSLPYTADDVDVSPKTDWAVGAIPTQEQMASYLQDIRTLRGLMPMPTDLAELPESMRYLDYAGANAIEATLLAVRDTVEVLFAQCKANADLAASAWRCAEINCGEV